MATTAEWLEDEREFEPLQREWDDLAVQASPFVTHAWVLAWWRAFGRGRLRICVARRDGRLVAGLPLVDQRGWLVSPTNAHSPRFQPVGDVADIARLLRMVVGDGPPVLALEHMPVDDPAVSGLAALSVAARRLTWIEPGRRSPIVETTGDPHDYLASRGRHVRRELARLRRKLVAEHDAVVTPFAQATDPGPAIEEMLQLEARGWKGRRGTAILQSDEATAFYHDIATRWADAGELRISSIRSGGALVAVDLCVVSHRRAWIPKGAYDERFARYSPGRVLLLAEIEAALDSELQAVELLGDADRYKLAFATSSRSLCTVHSCARSPVPLMRMGYRRRIRPPLHRVYRAARARKEGR